MKKFEYKRFKEEIGDKKLYELGQNRWELVSHHVIPRSLASDCHYYIFKKEVIRKNLKDSGPR